MLNMCELETIIFNVGLRNNIQAKQVKIGVAILIWPVTLHQSITLHLLLYGILSIYTANFNPLQRQSM